MMTDKIPGHNVMYQKGRNQTKQVGQSTKLRTKARKQKTWMKAISNPFWEWGLI